MSQTIVETYIKALGKRYESLLAEGFFPSADPWKIFDDDDQFSLSIEDGLSLTFNESTRFLESIFVTLIKTTPSTSVYTGVLPDAFAPRMSRSGVQKNFGDPAASKGPVKMPQPMGMTGGWDSYMLDRATYPKAKIVFHYTADLFVSTLVFARTDEDRN